MLSFRNRLTRADVDVIRQIADSTGFFDKNDVQINVDIAEDMLCRKDSCHKFILADYNGRTVAYACYGKVSDARDGTYEIYWLSTLNDYRGLGIGRQLISCLIDRLQKKGAERIYVKTDSKEQYEPTRRFYEKCGFRLQAVLPGYYDDNDNCCIYALQLIGNDCAESGQEQCLAAE